MRTSRLQALAFLALAAGALRADPPFTTETPDLGATPSAAELAALDITVMPDGAGLPPGSGTAREGAAVYRAHCLACHGEGGRGGLNDALAGGHGSLDAAAPRLTIGSYWPYATTVFDYVRRAMPYHTPGVLSNDELYAVTAYLLFVNDIIAAEAPLDSRSLPTVRMPNRDGFRSAVP